MIGRITGTLLEKNPPQILVDVHGVWSAWRDIAYTGNEPGPLPPRLIALDLASTYAGSPACPATLTLETALDWTERRPTSLQIVALFFPMASASTPPVAGGSPGPWGSKGRRSAGSWVGVRSGRVPPPG